MKGEDHLYKHEMVEAQEATEQRAATAAFHVPTVFIQEHQVLGALLITQLCGDPGLDDGRRGE